MIYKYFLDPNKFDVMMNKCYLSLLIFLGVGCVLVIFMDSRFYVLVILLWILDFMFSVIWSYVSCGLVCYLPICKSVCKSKIICLSTGERPFIDILQDRRYWVIHIITIPSLFIAGVIFVLSRFVYKLFGLPNFNQYFNKDNTQISLINDRFSSSLEIEDI